MATATTCIATVLPAGAAVPGPQRAALVDLYNDTNGASWTDSSSWLGDPGTECTWLGVTCDSGETTVTAVVLQSNNLQGSLPVSLEDLPDLQYLDLSGNSLSGTIPTELGALSSLLQLDLAHAGYGGALNGVVPPELGSLTSLEELSLAGNQLSGEIPTELGSLTNLYSLDLSSNRFASIPPGLGDLVNLSYLRLDRNRLVGPVPPSLANLTSLWDSSSTLDYNGLWADEPGLQAFLDLKFGSWEDTQTVAPTDLVVTSTTGVAAALGWTPINYSSDPGGYEVLVATQPTGPYTLKGSTADKSVSAFVVWGLAPSTTYHFQVRTVTEAGSNNQNRVVSEPATVSGATAGDSSTWYADTAGAPGNDCQSPASPCPTIQAALGLASAGEQVIAAAGIYPERVTLDAPVWLKGAGAGLTVVDAGGIGRALHVPGGVLQGFASGLTLRNGTAAFGGGVYVENGSSLLLTDSIITSCAAQSYGGGAFAGSGASLTLDRCIVTANQAPWGGGVASFGSLALRATTLDDNTASSFGGGGLDVEGGTTVVDGCTISGNHAEHGGGVANHRGALQLTNTTVSGNTGGGLFNDRNRTTSLDSCTVVGNTVQASRGSGTTNWGQLLLHGTILAGNEPRNCANPVTSQSYNLEDADSCGLDQTGDLVSTDPLLGALAANGGPTLTHALAAGSPAVDSGDPSYFPSVDQRGIPRPADGDHDTVYRADIGAFEVDDALFRDGFESGDSTFWSSTSP